MLQYLTIFYQRVADSTEKCPKLHYLHAIVMMPVAGLSASIKCLFVYRANPSQNDDRANKHAEYQYAFNSSYKPKGGAVRHRHQIPPEEAGTHIGGIVASEFIVRRLVDKRGRSASDERTGLEGLGAALGGGEEKRRMGKCI